MIAESDIFSRVICSGDPNVPDGTIGVLMNVFTDCVVIETPPTADEPDGSQWIVELGAVELLAKDQAA